MIVREIKKDPEGVLAAFDWFNDYDDTRAWCTHNFPEIIERLDAGFQEYLRRSYGGSPRGTKS